MLAHTERNRGKQEKNRREKEKNGNASTSLHFLRKIEKKEEQRSNFGYFPGEREIQKRDGKKEKTEATTNE